MVDSTTKAEEIIKKDEKPKRKPRRKKTDSPIPSKPIEFSKFQKLALKSLLYRWEKIMVPELFDRAQENKEFKNKYGLSISQAEKQIIDLNKKLSI
jgi:hypothetical protein